MAMYFDMSSYSAGGNAGPMWPQEHHSQSWYNNHADQGNYYGWGGQKDTSKQPWGQQKAWGGERPWGQDENNIWGQERNSWGQEMYGRQDDYNQYSNFQVLDSRLAQQASQLGHLGDEPVEVLVVNSLTSGAYLHLCGDAKAADLVAFDAEWAPDHAYGSDNPISVLQLAFPKSRRVYVIQLGRLDNKLPQDVQMMLVNPEVRKLGFAVDTNDRAKMARSGISLTGASVTDVQELSARSLGVPGNSLSLKNAAFGLLGMRLDKDKRLSCSDWASQELTPQQVRYAALDAWVPLRLTYMLSH
jgi:hypothetical protein